MAEIVSMHDVIKKYCTTKNNIDFYFGFDESFYQKYKDYQNIVFYMFRFTLYDNEIIDMWRGDAKLHTFTDKLKLEQFFQSLT